jgi:predicted DNA-binding transcriptional regulator AlpA
MQTTATAPTPFWTFGETASVTRYTTRWLRKLIKDGKFPRPRRLGRKLLFDPAEVREFMDSRREGPADAA